MQEAKVLAKLCIRFLVVYRSFQINFCRLLITFPDTLDPNRSHKIGPDLEPKLVEYTLMVSLKEYLEMQNNQACTFKSQTGQYHDSLPCNTANETT